MAEDCPIPTYATRNGILIVVLMFLLVSVCRDTVRVKVASWQ